MIRALLVSVLLFASCEVKAKAKPQPVGLLIAFQASWCGPCHQMNPVLCSLERQGFKVQRIDVDAYPKLAADCKITKVPTFVILKAGKEVARIVGVVKERVLTDLLKP